MDIDAGVGGALARLPEVDEEASSIIVIKAMHEGGLPLPADIAHLAAWRDSVQAGATKFLGHIGGFLALDQDSLALAVFLHPGIFRDVLHAEGIPDVWNIHIRARTDRAKDLLADGMRAYARHCELAGEPDCDRVWAVV